MRSIASLALAACLLSVTGAHADEASFLHSLQGKFAGKGMVRIRTNSPAMNISCTFTSVATANSLLLDGTCRALLIMSREIKADLKVSGTKYTGTYIGSRSGPAGLSGSREGNAIKLDIHWAKIINGDRDADMTVEKTGPDSMRMMVIDMDPATKKMVVTSQIDLERTK
ncbi:hypothetical protein FJ987_12095 [Mesorhizobium sp. CU2]|uniref:hypothetical protein n=1 Tax=unclassified Mesorhizobium TaxID=325217 RepID=UPI0011292A7D|nr:MULTISPECIES: hypothetical protein [unclassified Mesorhizobium]TPN88421.1 hypothetical protein FJ988_05085 [Mesorhizobium sp. CU3]TPO15604.1 hypothetical protein FJ987_12095 [Mesorhizobium sp. CU2]